MVKRTALLLLVTLASAAEVASGQNRCPDTTSIARCVQAKYSLGFRDSIIGAVAKKATSDAAVAPASIQDFLPLLAASVTTQGLEDDLTRLALTLNTPLNDGRLLDLGSRLQTVVKVNKPELYTGMLNALPEARRPVVRERLNGGLDELDDVQMTFTLSADNRRWGRTARFHSDVLGVLAHDVIRQLLASGTADIVTATANLRTALDGALDKSRADCTSMQQDSIAMGCILAARRNDVESAMANFATVSEEFASGSARLSTKLEVSHLADLINNQPQISAGVDWRPRDVLSGPQSAALRIRGEMGFANVNGLRRFCNAERRERERVERSRLAIAPVTVDCYHRYLAADDGPVKSSLRRGDRVWLSFDALRQREYEAPFVPEDSATLHLDSKWSLEGAAGYGFYALTGGGTDPQQTRVDLSARHVWNREAVQRPETRWVLAATVTHRVMEKLAVITGVQWANRAEFLDDDVRPVGVNFGVRYKFDQGK